MQCRIHDSLVDMIRCSTQDATFQQDVWSNQHLSTALQALLPQEEDISPHPFLTRMIVARNESVTINQDAVFPVIKN